MVPKPDPCHPTSTSHGPASREKKREGVALCLSGGGYRATLFHLGALRRLNELGVLARVDTISAVSGGSILAAFLASRLQPWPEKGAAPKWDEHIGDPVRALTKKNIRTLWVLRRLLHPGDSTIAVETLRQRYETVTQLKLTELPERPRFIFSATDLSFGVNWVFERDRVGSYLPGYTSPPANWSVARAVAASSCFPPAFEPMPIALEPKLLKGGGAIHDGAREELIRGLRLSDGGVYDNMGLEPVWKTHQAVLVSDGGATFDARPDAGTFGRLKRYTAIQGHQAAAVRKRWLIERYEAKKPEGAYWGVGGVARHYDDKAAGYGEALVARRIAQIRTDLDCFSDVEAGVLQNHGYLLADAAMRCHARDYRDADAPAAVLPCPDFAPGSEVAEHDLGSALAGSERRRILGRWKRLT